MFNFIIGAALLGLSAASYKQQRNAGKQAKREYETQTAENAKQSALVEKEKKAMEGKLLASRKKLNNSMARGNRGRVKGGLFGEAVTSTAMTDRLG